MALGSTWVRLRVASCGTARCRVTCVIRGCGDFDGEWVIHDTMNRRYGKTAPRFDRGVAGVVEPHSITPIEVDGQYHIDLLVPEGVLGKFNGEFGIRVQ